MTDDVALNPTTDVYTTSDKVAELLQLQSPFGVNTRPTKTVVNNIIQRQTEKIDRITRHSWRARRVTNWFYDFNAYGFGIGYASSQGYNELESRRFIDLGRRNIRSLTSGTHKLELYEGGNTYTDLVASATQGRGDDWYIDLVKGYIYFKNKFPLYRYNGLRATFDYGDTAVPFDIEEACTKLAAIEVLRTQDYTVLVSSGETDIETTNSKLESWKEEANDVLSRRQELIYVV